MSTNHSSAVESKYPASLSGLDAAARDGVALTVVWKSATCGLTDDQIKAAYTAEPDQRYVITQWEHGGKQHERIRN